MPQISGLFTNSTSTTVEYIIPDISNLVKKQILMLEYQTLKVNILMQLIIIYSLLFMIALIIKIIKT